MQKERIAFRQAVLSHADACRRHSCNKIDMQSEPVLTNLFFFVCSSSHSHSNTAFPCHCSLSLYTFDMRNLRRPRQIHKDHISAVIDVDYSPTGKELVSGSYDKTIRIFGTEEGRSREVYYTRRMQRLTSVAWSSDNKYILCGSDEMDIRIWKANRSEKLGIVSKHPDEINPHPLLLDSDSDDLFVTCLSLFS